METEIGRHKLNRRIHKITKTYAVTPRNIATCKKPQPDVTIRALYYFSLYQRGKKLGSVGGDTGSYPLTPPKHYMVLNYHSIWIFAIFRE